MTEVSRMGKVDKGLYVQILSKSNFLTNFFFGSLQCPEKKAKSTEFPEMMAERAKFNLARAGVIGASMRAWWTALTGLPAALNVNVFLYILVPQTIS